MGEAGQTKRAARTTARAAALAAALAFGPAVAQDAPAAEADAPWGDAGGGELPALIPLESPTLEDSEAPAVVRYTGRIVAQRTLVAPRGGLPEESLEPLLRVQQDTPYNPQSVRQDIAMLYGVLGFAQVEVHVEDWVAFGLDGEPIPAVRVEYRVFSPPRLRRVKVSGAHAMSARAVRAAAGRERGDAFFPEDLERVRLSVEQAYAAIGHPDASVDPRVTTDADGRVSLELVVSEGPPDRIQDIRVRGGGALAPLRISYILARHGLFPGRRVTEGAIRDARDALTRALHAAGYYEGRVALQVEKPAPGQRRLVVIVDPRRRWTIEREASTRLRRADVVDRLRLDEGVRLSRRFTEEAGRALTEDLQRSGHLDAQVSVSVDAADDRVLLRVTGDAGPVHRLGRAVWEGDAERNPRFLTGALREASPDVIGRGRITPEAVDAALEEVQEFYRSEGFLSAELSRAGFEPGPPDGRWWLRGVPVDIRVRVEAGPRTALGAVTVEGAPDGIDASGFFSDLQGKPLNPTEIDTRARRLVEALNERGHLSADAATSTVVSADGTSADVTVRITPGPTVYLRSVLLRGQRRTRRAVIEREVDLAPGQPLAPSRLAAIRRRLYELDLFTRVEVELVGDEDRAKDLVVTVQERPNLHAEVGGGVATDLGLKVFLRGGHRNLFGLGHRLTLLGQAGVGWLGDGWTLDWLAPEWKAAARYEAPNIPARSEHFALDILFNEQAQEPSYRLERSGGAASVLLRLGEKGKAELAYRVQLRRLLDVDPGVVVPGDPWLDELSLTDLGDPAPSLPSVTRPQSGLDLSFVVDLRDDPFNPRRGALGSFVLNVTDEVLSDLSFLRGEGSVSWWWPLGGLGLQGRLRGGAGWVPGGEGTLPLEDRFRLGGGADLRGFALDSVGPANRVSREDIDFNDDLAPFIDYTGRTADTRWVTTGGDAMALASLELRVPFERLGLARWAGTELAFFADTGNVWFLAPGTADSQSEPDEPLLRWSLGFGLRRATAIGPIQVDLGFNPMPVRGEGWGQVHVTVGAL
jgi:outer membrane protein assembly factor BamA